MRDDGRRDLLEAQQRAFELFSIVACYLDRRALIRSGCWRDIKGEQQRSNTMPRITITSDERHCRIGACVWPLIFLILTGFLLQACAALRDTTGVRESESIQPGKTTPEAKLGTDKVVL